MEKDKNKAFYTFGRFQSAPLDFKEVTDRKDWVSFGVKNDFPQELIRLYDTASPLHTALIDKKVQMSSSAGWNQDKFDDIKKKLFFKNRFSDDNLDVLANKAAFDLAIFNGFYLNIVWDETGENIAQIDHIPFEKGRAQKSLEEDPQNYYVSRDWLNSRKAINKPVLLPGFDSRLAKVDDEGINTKSQILFVGVYSPGMDYYPLPKYKSSINSIKTLYEASLFQLKSIQNGFSAGAIITHIGEYDPEEQDDIYNDTKANYTGADNANDFIMMFAPTKEEAPIITPIELTNIAKKYIEIKGDAIEELIQGHQATSPIAGREVSGKLGASNEILEAHEVFQLTVIDGMQKIIEDTFNKLAEFNGIVEPDFNLNTFNFLTIEEVEENPNEETNIEG